MSNTVMTEALREAGIYMPQNKRIWMWVKDRPNYTASEIGAALKIAGAAVAGYLRDMEKRKMVKSVPASRRLPGGGRGKRGHMVDRLVDTWTVNPKMEEFELWPLPAKPKEKKDPRPVAEAPAQAALVKQDVPAAPKPSPTWTPEAAVESFSLAQCRELFNYLHKIFKE